MKTSMNANAPPSIAVLITSFNRRDKTLSALASLSEQATGMPRRLHVFLVDDASSDDTKEAVMAKFPQVTIIEGTGSLYWNGGMRLAFDHAMRVDFDSYLWLNDDVQLYTNALDILLRTDQHLRANGVVSIITGSTCDPITHLRTFGGTRRLKKPFYFEHISVQPSLDEPISCETMNGNCTLIPAEIARSIGNLDGRFQHHFGDIDYGYRATAAGFSVHVAPGFVGICPNDSIAGTWRDRGTPTGKRWKDLMSPKGYRFNEWFLFARRHYGYLWPLYFSVPYVKCAFPFRRAEA